MKTLRLGTLFLLICMMFCSCNTAKYKNVYEANGLTAKLKNELTSLSDFSAYSEEDIKFMLDTDKAESVSVLYSPDGDDIGEVGIMRVREGDHSGDVLKEAQKYIEQFKEQRSAFVKNYMPQEAEKLNGADTVLLGRYVCFCILEKDVTKTVFDKLKVILME